MITLGDLLDHSRNPVVAFVLERIAAGKHWPSDFNVDAIKHMANEVSKNENETGGISLATWRR